MSECVEGPEGSITSGNDFEGSAEGNISTSEAVPATEVCQLREMGVLGGLLSGGRKI